MYRPEGWKNPLSDVRERWGYEKGADAMVEALIAKGRRIESPKDPAIENLALALQANLKGYLVWIPDDERAGE